MPGKTNPDTSITRGTLHARVEGRVQGVGFRYSTVREARRLKLGGYVRNLWDGSVEVVAEGPLGNLKRLERWLNQGPPGAVVRAVDSRYGEYEGLYRSFNVEF